jgi:hypothetical protein
MRRALSLRARCGRETTRRTAAITASRIAVISRQTCIDMTTGTAGDWRSLQKNVTRD